MKNLNNKFLSLLFFACWIVDVAQVNAITYTSISDGFWSNSATWDANGVPPTIINNDDIVIINDHNVRMDVDITNNGIIEVSDGVNGTSFLIINVDVTLTNNHILRSAAGTFGAGLEIYGILTNSPTGSISWVNEVGYITLHSGGVLTNANTIFIGTFVTIELQEALTNDGTITLSGSLYTSAAITNNGTINNDNGYIDNASTITNNGSFTGTGIYGGNGTFSGSIYNNMVTGTLGNGSLDCINFSTDMTSSGTINFTLGGTMVCTQHSKITVTGTATITGSTLGITTFFPFNPTIGDVFNVFEATEISGEFANNSFDLGTGAFANLYYLPTVGTKTSIEMRIEATALPIELINFDVTTDVGKNHLAWRTASEKDNKQFDIERSTDGSNFHFLGQVIGNNKPSSYQYTDHQPFSTTYYRLKQVDYDGTETYSKIVAVTNKGNKTLKVYPTLVSNGFLTIDTEESEYSIYDILGQQVQSGQITKILDVSALTKGTYILSVGNALSKFVKL